MVSDEELTDKVELGEVDNDKVVFVVFDDFVGRKPLVVKVGIGLIVDDFLSIYLLPNFPSILPHF